MTHPLRDYQTDMVDAFNRAARRGHKAMYGVLPTGCGKTRVASELIAGTVERGNRVLWVVHTRELVAQAAEAIAARLGETATVGVVMAEQDQCTADVVVGSIQTLRSDRLDRVHDANPIRRLIIDECHHVTPDNTYAGLVQRMPEGTVTIGITATPFRADTKVMQEVLPHCAYERTIPDMIQDGWLCDLRYRQVAIDALDLSEARMSRKLGELDFAMRDLAPAVERPDVIESTVYETIEHLVDGRPALCFAASVAHARDLAACYNRAGYAAAAVWGDQPKDERAEVLRQWRAGRIQVVTNCAVLTEGFDFPEISTVIVARPTMSVSLYTQMIGRGTRLAEGKDDCVIVDITGRMPARAVPIDLADIVGEDLDEPAADGTAKVRKPKDKDKHGFAVHALRDPYGKARWSWTEHPHHPGVWFAPVASDLTCILAPDPKGSGLYCPYVIPVVNWRVEQPQRASSDWVPRRQAIADLEATLARANRVQKSLAHRDKAWRSEIATEKQMGLLKRMDGNLYKVAYADRWSKGDVALAITAVQITKAVGAVTKANAA